MTTTAPPVAGDRAGPARPSPAATAADGWRRWRAPLAIVILVLLGGAAVALLQPAGTTLAYLDPADVGPAGAHALADVLGQRGDQVIRATTAAQARTAADTAAPGGVTVVVTSPEFLTRAQLATLAGAPGGLLIVQPDPAVLAALAPAVSIGGPAAIGLLPPGCTLPAATLAGTADLGGLGLILQSGAQAAAGCYPLAGQPSLVRYLADGKVITVLGTGEPLSNEFLGQAGNAALALNLLGTRSRVVWLVPSLAAPAATGHTSLIRLIPLGADLLAVQLGIVVLLTALWRARRLGPLVAEPLPVIVRASETVEGHARLYASRRARGQAAAALRAGTLGRLIPAAGLRPAAPPGEIIAALAARSGLGPAKIEMMFFGPAPASDAALVTLADELDALERKVRAQ